MSLIQRQINQSRYPIKCPYPMSPIGVCIHNTANDASARNEADYMERNNNQTSFHIVIDDKEALQLIPFDRNAWHAGDGHNGQGNRKYIAVEICYSKSGGQRFADAEERTVKEVALLLKNHGWGIDRVKAHRDFAKKNCPHRTDMTSFKNRVQAELNRLNASQEKQPYRQYLEVVNDIPAFEKPSNIVKKFKAGDKLTAVDVISGWYKLDIDGKEAWIPSTPCKKIN